MLAVDSEQFNSSLCGVIDWCATHHSTMVRDSDKAAFRRNQCEMAFQLIEEARMSRSVLESDQWKQALVLLSQIRESMGPLESRLRSLGLMPSKAIDELRTDEDWLQAVSEVVNKRSSKNKQNASVGEESVSAGSGRLLAYFPHENLADGAADFSSGGFYDVNNVPPWDLWVSFSDGVLISWVPLGLIEVAHMGIDANPEECISWLRQ
jgi:hypothetical protein